MFVVKILIPWILKYKNWSKFSIQAKYNSTDLISIIVLFILTFLFLFEFSYFSNFFGFSLFNFLILYGIINLNYGGEKLGVYITLQDKWSTNEMIIVCVQWENRLNKKRVVKDHLTTIALEKKKSSNHKKFI